MVKKAEWMLIVVPSLTQNCTYVQCMHTENVTMLRLALDHSRHVTVFIFLSPLYNQYGYRSGVFLYA